MTEFYSPSDGAPSDLDETRPVCGRCFLELPVSGYHEECVE